MSLFGILNFMRWGYKKSKEEYYREKILLRFKKDNPTLITGEEVTIRIIKRLKVGKNVILDSHCFLHCGGMNWSKGKGLITLGNNVYIGPHSVLFGAGEIEIGNDVLISPNVTITSHQHTYANISKPIREQTTIFGKVVIKDDVWIGSNAVILPSITIGKGAVIGAGAVVTKNIPPFCIATGVPAEVVKKR